MNQDLTEKLIAKAPYMFVLRHKDETMKKKGDFYPITYGFECSNGWEIPIGNLIDDLVKVDPKKEILICQVKEKFGGLRFYLEKYTSNDDTNAFINKRITEAEKACADICEVCGAPGKLIVGGWWATLCDTCNNK